MAYVMDLGDLDETQAAVAGGKGANLGELTRIAGVSVPPGFCVTTRAFDRAMADVPSLDGALDRLARLGPDEADAIAALSAELRHAIEATRVPAQIASAITGALGRLGDGAPCAVRSSATAEDLPCASFGGQQDSYLDVAGAPAVIDHVRRCWASLFTQRAVTYRLRNGYDHRQVRMAVVVQRMVPARAAGVLFTADPVTSNRKVVSVEAVAGLGEALVSGHVTPDVFTVGDGAIVARTVATEAAVLTDEQVLRLAALGRRIEAHFGRPQDIEWCLADDRFAIVQSRPITTLFPIPESADGEPHVYVSVGHQQMMTDAMKPLGLSVWQATTPRPMAEAGGRLFVDVAPALAMPESRARHLAALGKSDPLIGDALQTIVDRGDLIRPLPDTGPAGPPMPGESPPIDPDPAIVTELIERNEASVAALEDEIAQRSGPALVDFVLDSFSELRSTLFDPRGLQLIMAGMDATWWLNERLEAWLGERNVGDRFTQSLPHNVTAEMGLALLDVADVVRRHPQVVAYLERVEEGGVADEHFLDELGAVAGGEESRAAIEAYLQRYGMRCVGEIDITRPRWSEQPTTLVPMILGNVRNHEPGAGRRRFEQGLRDVEATRDEVLQRLRALPDGATKAADTERMIDRVRAFAGYREYPKYGMVCRYFVLKRALLAEAERLVDAGVLGARDDLFYLRLEELGDVVRTGAVDDRLIRERRKAFAAAQALRPPRVFTSDGEVFGGAYRRDDLPPGALPGLAVSAGTVEGRARVVLDVAHADLEPGDILVTAFTDPSWTPLFVAVQGLVTEVGGLMTHGAVIAREYGLPAVVGVQDATRLIRDGQRIRVHGAQGYVEILA